MNKGKKKLEFLRNLNKGWNGYDSETISDELIDHVYEIYDQLKEIFNVEDFEIFPTSRKTIQLENYIDFDNFIDIEISLNEISVLEMKNGEEIEYPIENIN